MSAAPRQDLTPADVLHLLRYYARRWIVPAVLIAAGVGAFAAFKPDTWEASQTITVRNDGHTYAAESPGKFRHENEMKTSQDTIVEIALSHNVLHDALAKVGPPANRTDSEAFPSDYDIDRLRKKLKVTPPKGSEFGSAEVFYLRVKDKSRDRAIALARAVGEQVEAKYSQIRHVRASNLIEELTATVSLAKDDLQEATQQLAAMEAKVGGDLVELRMLHQSHNGNGDLNRSLTEAQADLRKALTQKSTDESLLKLLQETAGDPNKLLTWPRSLLESQPGLKRLSEGLSDAQLRTAGVLGKFTELHPMAIAAKREEDMIHQNIFHELESVQRGVQADLQVASASIEVLEQQLALPRDRMDRLAGLRAEYSALADDVANRRRLLDTAQRNLAEARASQMAAQSSSLVTLIDQPDGGYQPTGPHRGVIALLGVAGGLLAGFGLVFLTVPSIPPRPAAAAPLPARPATERFEHVAHPVGNGKSLPAEQPGELVMAP